MQLPTEFIPLKDGTQICAPANITLMTPFVLHEQGDWFEDEIKFVRRFIQPGMHALDIGANYGLYATAIAKRMGPKGKLWCFEPTPATAESLRKTIKKNKYKGRVKVREEGLSDRQGKAVFHMSPNAELNTLEPGAERYMHQQEIKLETLDGFYEKEEFPHIDFVKLDAEGEEAKIVNGGVRFFSEQSPIVMFELMHVDRVNNELIEALRHFNYEYFRLVPGLNVLTSVDVEAKMDRYQLNIFGIKKESIQNYIDRGVIVQSSAEKCSQESPMTGSGEFLSKLGSVNGLVVPEANDAYVQVLESLAFCGNKTSTVQDRFEELERAFSIVESMQLEGCSLEELSSFSRVAFELGERDFGMNIIELALKKLVSVQANIQIRWLYCPPIKNLESRLSKFDAATGLASCLIETYIRMAHRSAYFTGDTLLPYLAELRRLLGGLDSDLMKKERVILARSKALVGK